MNVARPNATFRAVLPYLAFVVVAIGFLNFLWFMSETLPLNLIPSDGRVVDGHYLLWSKTHGGYVEVSRPFWEWVRFHEPTVFLSWPLVILAMGFVVLTHLSGLAAGGAGSEASAERVLQVRDSGPLLASTRTAGLIGTAWFSRGLLRIDAYPDGLVVKPLLMAERAILAGEIVAVKPDGGLSAESAPERRPILGVGMSQVAPGYRPKGPSLEIVHAGVGMASPLVLAGSGNWGIAQAIRGQAAAAQTGTGSGEVAGATGIASARPSLEDQLPSAVKAGLGILGVIVGVALIWSGITWAIPELGLPGVAWTVFVVLILAVNVRRSLMERRR